MKPRKLLKRPLANADELDQLTAWVGERRARRVSRLRFARLVAGVVVAVNVLTTLSHSGVDMPGRFFSLIAILGAAVLLTPGTVRKLRTHPRLVVAQRQLLRHRGLVAGDGIDALRGEIARLAKRIRKRLTALDRDDAILAAAERRARRLLDQLAASEKETGTAVDGRRYVERTRLHARLESFRVALAAMEVEALLRPPGGIEGGKPQRPGFYAGDGAIQALHSAVALLEGAGEKAGTQEVLVTPRPLLVDAGWGTPEAYRRRRRRQLSSIAVLPFTDLSPEQDQEYFCHGLAEELINALTQIQGLRVIARGSSFSFLAGQRDVREIGRALGVETLVEGSVRKAGTALRITVQLIRTDDGSHLWSERYDREAGDVFAIQDEITAALMEHLHLELLGDQELRRSREIDLEAYHLYLRARHLWNKRTPTELHGSADLFQQAIARDPGFALAHAGLADAYVLLGFYSVLPPHEAFPKAITAASQALDLDAALAEAHSSLAFAALLYQWDFAGATESFHRALELNPGYTTAYHWYSECLGLAGHHEEALEKARIANDLDPLSPITHTLLGWVFHYGRRDDEAIEALNKTLELEADFAPAEFWLGLAYVEKGRFEEAEKALAGAVAHSNRSTMMLAAYGRLKAVVGEIEQAQEILAELRDLSRTQYVPAYYCAAIQAGCGDVEDAFGCLARAYEERDNWMVFLGVDPIWDDLRGEARFEELMKNVGFDG